MWSVMPDRQPPTTRSGRALFSAKFSNLCGPFGPICSVCQQGSVVFRQAPPSRGWWLRVGFGVCLNRRSQIPAAISSHGQYFGAACPYGKCRRPLTLRLWFLMQFGGRMKGDKGDKGDRKGDGLREMPYFVRSLVGSVPVSKWPSETPFRFDCRISVHNCREVLPRPLPCVVDPQLSPLMSRASFQKPRDNAKEWGRSLPRWSGGWVRSSGDGH
ncbi:hypothetical protein F5144DRAFT_227648 [Chaetomium tenue]|uniref:Uncharacterized protein n=1 Tax=Chaetomium tenue TaxID=1854479 RepID=A0ACB7P6N9_9PEZI|nr:hypothetical protein F5144DRAFT_227648 [Chaetomium globosum]